MARGFALDISLDNPLDSTIDIALKDMLYISSDDTNAYAKWILHEQKGQGK